MYWDTAYDTVSGGVGNPGGIGSRNNATTNQTACGTGGLLIIVASEIENNSQITAKGTSSEKPVEGTYKTPGGASGGGSVNIFLNMDTNKMGTINVDGGTGNANGGKGSISIGNISTGEYVKLELE